MALLEVKELSHMYGDKKLYQNASFELYKGEHMGVVGPNGTGKSTLVKIILGDVLPDDGTITFQKGITVGHLDQYADIDLELTIYDYLKTAFKWLYDTESKITKLYEEMINGYTDSLMNRIEKYQKILDTNNFYETDSKIQKAAYGLGLNIIGLQTKIGNLSGGQRAKVILAKLLLQNPDVLILDEPTIFWIKNI